jgi:hypothetical protein
VDEAYWPHTQDQTPRPTERGLGNLSGLRPAPASCYHPRMPVRLKVGFAYNSHDAVATYEGAGSLVTECGARMACEFRADQDCNGVVQVRCHRILPSDFAFPLLALMDTGGSASFRGTTAAGATVVMNPERGGRPLSLDTDGYGSMYFLPRKLAVYEKEPPSTCHRFLFDELRVFAVYASRRVPAPAQALVFSGIQRPRLHRPGGWGSRARISGTGMAAIDLTLGADAYR